MWHGIKSYSLREMTIQCRICSHSLSIVDHFVLYTADSEGDDEHEDWPQKMCEKYLLNKFINFIISMCFKA